MPARTPARIQPLPITAFTATCAAASGRDAIARAVETRSGGLRANDFGADPLPCFIGRVAAVESTALPPQLARWDARNHRLAWIALNCDGFIDRAREAIARYGADRVGLVMGTSTSSIDETENAYRHLTSDGHLSPEQQRADVHQTNSITGFVQAALGMMDLR